MRIGIVTGEYPPMHGGVSAYTQILAQHLAARGHDVFVFTNRQGAAEDPEIHLRARISRWGLLTMLAIGRWARHNQLDAISLQFETAAFGMSPWIHFLPNIVRNVPIVTTFHDLFVPYLFPKAGPLRRWIVLRLARASAGVIVTNHEDYAQMRILPRVTLVPIGSNILPLTTKAFDRELWRSRAGAKPDEFLIGYFGFINRTKGVDILLEDIAEIRDTYGYPLKLVMIGGKTGSSDPSNAAYLTEIEALINQLNLADAVLWTDFVDDTDVAAYMTAVDVMALPFLDGASYRRGSLMAAIYQGCAIITTAPFVDIPLFEDRRNMLLAQPRVIHEAAPPFIHITPELLLVYRHPELHQRLRDGARALAQYFDWDQIADDYVDFINEALGGTP
jgi:glycosyltransferase involved in cell wall biosynthesis